MIRTLDSMVKPIFINKRDHSTGFAQVIHAGFLLAHYLACVNSPRQTASVLHVLQPRGYFQ